MNVSNLKNTHIANPGLTKTIVLGDGTKIKQSYQPCPPPTDSFSSSGSAGASPDGGMAAFFRSMNRARQGTGIPHSPVAPPQLGGGAAAQFRALNAQRNAKREAMARVQAEQTKALLRGLGF